MVLYPSIRTPPPKLREINKKESFLTTLFWLAIDLTLENLPALCFCFQGFIFPIKHREQNKPGHCQWHTEQSRILIAVV